MNIKKIILLVVIILIIIITISSIVIFKFTYSNKIEQDTNSLPYTIFTDKNNSIKLTLSKDYGLTSFSSDNYLLELRSDNNLDIFVSHETLIENRSLSDIAKADLDAYLKEYKTYSNLSELREFKKDDKSIYTYSLDYLDSQIKTAFYLQVIWFETENGYYIIDIEFPLDDLDNYKNIINETIDNFKIL